MGNRAAAGDPPGPPRSIERVLGVPICMSCCARAVDTQLYCRADADPAGRPQPCGHRTCAHCASRLLRCAVCGRAVVFAVQSGTDAVIGGARR